MNSKFDNSCYPVMRSILKNMATVDRDLVAIFKTEAKAYAFIDKAVEREAKARNADSVVDSSRGKRIYINDEDEIHYYVRGEYIQDS